MLYNRFWSSSQCLLVGRRENLPADMIRNDPTLIALDVDLKPQEDGIRLGCHSMTALNFQLWSLERSFFSL